MSASSLRRPPTESERPATTRTIAVIVSDESYGGIVVNRRVYKGASDRIAKGLRRSCCRRL